MRDKLVLRFLGFLETMKYILEQSHGVPPVSVALDHTTLKEEGSCGYSSVKTVRSIVCSKLHLSAKNTLLSPIGLPCCVLPFLVSVWYPQALSHTPSRERGNA